MGLQRIREPNVPADVLVPLINDMQRRIKHCPDTWKDEDFEDLKALCGPEYANVTRSRIRITAINLRKRKMLEPTTQPNNKGQGKHPPPPPEYQEYLESLAWRERSAKFREAWDNRCALCYSTGTLQVHHRTYERIGNELNTDCIPLCKPCHKFADKQRRKNNDKTVDGNGLF